MKTAWQLRREKLIEVPQNPDSEYKQVERKKRLFNPLVVPKVIIDN